MKKQLIVLASLALWYPGVLFGCAPQNQTQQGETQQGETQPLNAQQGDAQDETATLQFYANGEDFVRQGFVSKDGWNVSFDHVYTTLADVTAYQTEPAYNPDEGADLQAKAKTQASLDDVQVVDLAEGGEDADPILVGEVQNAPVGQYNAISFNLVEAPEGPAQGYAIVIDGTANKGGQNVDFTLKVPPEYEFLCGEYVGDVRKGILEPNDQADLEMTFHFDHIFGDADAPATDEINTGALGFQPLAALAKDGKLEADMAVLEQQLSPEDYQKLRNIIPSLGHVGEGHCRETKTTTALN